MFKGEELDRRVANASDAGLVVLLYEGLMENLEESKKCIELKEYKKLNSINNKSRDILNELIITLEGDSQIALNLKNIYMFLNKLITNGESRRDALAYEKAIEIVKPLHEAFKELEKTNDPKVVAGLSYGRSGVEDYTVKENKIFKG